MLSDVLSERVVLSSGEMQFTLQSSGLSCEHVNFIVDLIEFSPSSGKDNVSSATTDISNVAESASLLDDEVWLISLLYVSDTSSAFCGFCFSEL